MKKNQAIVTLLLTLVAAAALPTRARAADDKDKMDHKKAGAMEKKAMAGEKVEILITDKSFEPKKIEVKMGQPVELVFTRKTDATCVKEVVLDTGAKKIEKKLPLDKPVTIKTKFTKSGDLTYACKMNMFSGIVAVQ